MPPSLNHTFYYIHALTTTVKGVNDKYDELTQFLRERSIPIGPLCLLGLLICLCACKPSETKGCCWPILLTVVTLGAIAAWTGWFLEDLWTQPEREDGRN